MPMHAEELVRQYQLISDQISQEQLQVILRELEHCLDKNDNGAVVEFGCYIGTTSLFIRRLLDLRGEGESHPFHVYDSFAGLPAKTQHDQSPAGEQFTAGELAVSKRQFIEQFNKVMLDLPVIHKGWFSTLQPVDIPEQICFAFLDGDFYESIRDSLRAVLPRLTAHATIIFDDFSREALPGVARAVHNYLPPELGLKLRSEQNLGIIAL